MKKFSEYIGIGFVEAVAFSGIVYKITQSPIDWTAIIIFVILAYLVWKVKKK